MKRKPHQKRSVSKKVFEDFRKRLHPSSQSNNGIEYEVKEIKTGFKVVIHRERGMNQELYFDSKQSLDQYLKTIS